jgi:ubiquinone/menaquinone biosynthesis C-methylase UbiE
MSHESHHSANQARGDYRTSHLYKGHSYDDDLSTGAWNKYLAEQERRIIWAAIKKFSRGRPRRCMDFACGTGRVTAALEDLVGECIGIDVSPGMLERAKEKCKKTRFYVCDLTKDAPNLGVFDLITAFRFFGNAQDELRAEALSALYHYLEPDGYLILNNHRNPNALQNVLHRWSGGETNMDLTLTKLKRHARSCGFEVADICGIGAWSLRHRWQSWVENPSKGVPGLERISGLRAFATFAPDWIVVLRKRPKSMR